METSEKKAFPRRGIFILPSLLTTANIFCGFFAITILMTGERDAMDLAAKAIGIAILLDGLDGRLARMTGTTSQFGLQLDSLADAISFGLAPAVMLLNWPRLLHCPQDYWTWGWIACFLYMVCGVMRLARFNVQTPGIKHFLGLPIPAAAGVVAALVHFSAKYPDLRIFSPEVFIYWLFPMATLLGIFMISTMRFASMKSLSFNKDKPYFTIVLIALLLTGVYFFSHELLMAIAGLYFLSGIVGTLRRKLFAHHSQPVLHEHEEVPAE